MMPFLSPSYIAQTVGVLQLRFQTIMCAEETKLVDKETY